ncbi:hypothetical protein FBUS_03331 [Fasciolopsis buskii]|uniref:Kinesin light chain n=1 Tax=Fasciolopsis buskii TaxID=27845 RepID=A0A8E0S2W6_9TREM|nr:hypothetical protein FBUS_03331 [Fasciolopsis buski]
MFSGRLNEGKYAMEQTTNTLFLEQIKLLRGNLASLTKRIDNRLRNQTNVNKMNKNSVPEEFRVEHSRRVLTLLKSKSHASEVSTYLLETVAEVLDFIDQGMNNARLELRNLSRENRELKANISYLIEKIYEAESQLASARESGAYWRFMRQLLHLDYKRNVAGDESLLWNACIPYDSLWNTEYAGFVSQTIQTVMDKISSGNMKDIPELVEKIPVREDQDKASYATVLQKIAQRCYQQDCFKICLDMLNKSLEIRVSTYGSNHPIISTSLNCLALVYGEVNEVQNATKFALDAISIMDRHLDMPNNRPLMAQQYMQTGQMLVSFSHVSEGIRAMQTAVGIWEDLLPREEDHWCHALNHMARTCNDNDYHDDAMGLGFDLIEYFHMKVHGSVSDRYPTIYEVAYAHELALQDPQIINLDLYPMGNPVYLNRAQQMALGEIAIGFACRGELKAAQVIATYLYICTSNSAPNFESGAYSDAHSTGRSETRSVRFVTPELYRVFRDRDTEKKSLLKILKKFFKVKR